ncbi:MAG: radical SAM protein [Crenarchaeota archaeon]|jgi:putative pyruvate formate lyase activating enzyme|nr:radical SAM protein [Thermoproteota archaeon]
MVWRTISSDKELAKGSLARYFAIVKNTKKAKFSIAKKVSAKFTDTEPLETLWQQHVKCTEAYCRLEYQIDNGKDYVSIPFPKQSYLDLKKQVTNKILKSCCLCTHRCGVNRLAHQLGYCGCGNKVAVSSIFIHTGEEPELVPSGTIFTMGCTIQCKHCQNWTISQWKESNIQFTPKEMAMEVEALHLNGCRNINLVGGEPTPWLKHWIETFSYVGANLPVVWNSNSYYSQETAQLLAGFADVYLLDFKYGPGDCAKRLSDAPGYWAVNTRNHLLAKRYGELIVRVLVLPGHLECCTQPILQWIAQNLGVQTRVNLMFQYRPEWRAYEIPELLRRLTKEEMDRALGYAHEVGLCNLVT